MAILSHNGNSGSGYHNQAGTPVIDLLDVDKFYRSPAGDYHALKTIDLHINAGEFVSIIGKSGSGKSTLLNMITGIDRPTIRRSACQWHPHP